MATRTRANTRSSVKPQAGTSASGARDQESTGDALHTMTDVIQCLRDDMKRMEESVISHLTLELKQQISQLRDELKRSIKDVSNRTMALEVAPEIMQTAVSANSDAIDILEVQVQQLRKDMKTSTDRHEDQEARLRRCNLRISGVKEGREMGKTTVAFMADLLKDALGLDSPRTLDMGYRTLRVHAFASG